MFGWLKKRSEQAPQQREGKIRLTYVAVESGLKDVENHWAVGNAKAGNELLEPLFRAALVNFVEYSEGQSTEVHKVQFLGLRAMFTFLLKHRQYDYLAQLARESSKYAENFQPDEIPEIMHLLEMATEALQAKSGKSETRHLYYVCQRCGGLNLIATAPCVICGFASSSERDMRRALLLSSMVLHTPTLLEISKNLQAELSKSPRRTLEQLWKPGDLDQFAAQHTSQFDESVPTWTQRSIANAGTFSGIPNLSVKCLTCGNEQRIASDRRDQTCTSCGASIPAPFFRKLKAAMTSVLTWIIWHGDHREDITYTNVIGFYVLLLDYALRRDTPPTKRQAQELVDRIVFIGPLTYLSRQVQIDFRDRVPVMSLSKNNELTKGGVQAFHSHVAELQQLFSMLTSDQLQA